MANTRFFLGNAVAKCSEAMEQKPFQKRVSAKNQKSNANFFKYLFFILLAAGTLSTTSGFAQKKGKTYFTSSNAKDKDSKLAAFKELLNWEVKETDVVFTKMLEDISGTKDELFVNAKSWLVDFYNDAKEVIQQDDKNAGVLKGKGNFTVAYSEGLFGSNIEEVVCEHTITINVKDGRVRMVISAKMYTYYYTNKEGTTKSMFPIVNYPPAAANYKRKFLADRADNSSEYWFMTLCERVNEAFASMEKSIKDASSLQSDW